MKNWDFTLRYILTPLALCTTSFMLFILAFSIMFSISHGEFTILVISVLAILGYIGLWHQFMGAKFERPIRLLILLCCGIASYIILAVEMHFYLFVPITSFKDILSWFLLLYPFYLGIVSIIDVVVHLFKNRAEVNSN